MRSRPLLNVRSVSKSFTLGKAREAGEGFIKAVDDVSFEVMAGQTLGIVGESGCGKSTLARLIMRLMDPDRGSIELDGEDLTRMSGAALRRKRADFQMVFQDPYACLNPRMRVRDLIAEPLRIQRVERSAWSSRIAEVSDRVGLTANLLKRYAHECSGGQRQRVGIARALILKPKLLIADEPVAALDVSIQAQILNVLADLRSAYRLTTLFIAHDLAVVNYMSDQVAVMYLGRLVEQAPAETIYRQPLHPYTKLLMSSEPVPDPRQKRKRERQPMAGELPGPVHRPAGCPFHPRCPLAHDRCRQEKPPLRAITPEHRVACHAIDPPEQKP